MGQNNKQDKIIPHRNRTTLQVREKPDAKSLVENLIVVFLLGVSSVLSGRADVLFLAHFDKREAVADYSAVG